MTPEQIDRIVYKTNYTTIDPTVTFQGKPMPALTTLLHRICHNDPKQFEEATRIVDLFIRKAIAVTVEVIHEQA